MLTCMLAGNTGRTASNRNAHHQHHRGNPESTSGPSHHRQSSLTTVGRRPRNAHVGTPAKRCGDSQPRSGVQYLIERSETVNIVTQLSLQDSLTIAIDKAQLVIAAAPIAPAHTSLSVVILIGLMWLLRSGRSPMHWRLPRNLISALTVVALLPLADQKPATTASGRVCVWTAKVTRLHRSCPQWCR